MARNVVSGAGVADQAAQAHPRKIATAAIDLVIAKSRPKRLCILRPSTGRIGRAPPVVQSGLKHGSEIHAERESARNPCTPILLSCGTDWMGFLGDSYHFWVRTSNRESPAGFCLQERASMARFHWSMAETLNASCEGWNLAGLALCRPSIVPGTY